VQLFANGVTVELPNATSVVSGHLRRRYVGLRRLREGSDPNDHRGPYITQTHVIPEVYDTIARLRGVASYVGMILLAVLLGGVWGAFRIFAASRCTPTPTLSTIENGLYGYDFQWEISEISVERDTEFC